MKRAAVASAALLAVATLLTGCQKEEVEKLVAPIVADVQETPEATEVEEEKSPLIPEIDDTLSIEEGARIAVLSKAGRDAKPQIPVSADAYVYYPEDFFMSNDTNVTTILSLPVIVPVT